MQSQRLHSRARVVMFSRFSESSFLGLGEARTSLFPISLVVSSEWGRSGNIFLYCQIGRVVMYQDQASIFLPSKKKSASDMASDFYLSFIAIVAISKQSNKASPSCTD